MYISNRRIVDAKPMTRKEYNDFREWELPSDENGADAGFILKEEQPKGFYVNWVTKQVFEDSYTKLEGEENQSMTFGMAIEAMKKGEKVAREGWNGKGMFAYYVPANAYPAQTKAAKSHFGQDGMVPYRAYIALKTAQEDIAMWSPSGSDALAIDWMVV